jgi:hypothetical protein
MMEGRTRHENRAGKRKKCDNLCYGRNYRAFSELEDLIIQKQQRRWASFEEKWTLHPPLMDDVVWVHQDEALDLQEEEEVKRQLAAEQEEEEGQRQPPDGPEVFSEDEETEDLIGDGQELARTTEWLLHRYQDQEDVERLDLAHVTLTAFLPDCLIPMVKDYARLPPCWRNSTNNQADVVSDL